MPTPPPLPRQPNPVIEYVVNVLNMWIDQRYSPPIPPSPDDGEIRPILTRLQGRLDASEQTAVYFLLRYDVLPAAQGLGLPQFRNWITTTVQSIDKGRYHAPSAQDDGKFVPYRQIERGEYKVVQNEYRWFQKESMLSKIGSGVGDVTREGGPVGLLVYAAGATVLGPLAWAAGRLVAENTLRVTQIILLQMIGEHLSGLEAAGRRVRL